MLAPWKKRYDQPRQHIKKQRHYFANKGLSSQSYGFSSSVQFSSVAQLCPTLYDPIDSSPPGSPVPGILQARTLEWVAISFSRESSQPSDQTQVSHTVDRRFTVWAIRVRNISRLFQNQSTVPVPKWTFIWWLPVSICLLNYIFSLFNVNTVKT